MEFFDETQDDDELFNHVFQSIDRNNDGAISLNEALAAVQVDSGDEQAQLQSEIKAFFDTGNQTVMNFESFKRIVHSVPRARGERVQWVNGLKLTGFLAKRLKPGTLSDPLKGLKGMTDTEVNDVLFQFAEDVKRRLALELQKLRQAPVGTGMVHEHINTKFQMSDAFLGSFATLDDFYGGLESRIGTPNPRVMEGMKNEHCIASNAKKKFRTNNYNLVTWPAQEWDFVVDPQDGVAYPHTPELKKDWPIGMEWKGEHGRKLVKLEKYMEIIEVKKAELKEVEVVAVRLYTGPMFVLVCFLSTPFFYALAYTLS